jgi:hypothetical protein
MQYTKAAQDRTTTISRYILLAFLVTLMHTGVFAQIQKHFFPYTFELNVADKAIYDQATNRWVQSGSVTAPPTYLSFTYTLKNLIDTKPGKITAYLDEIPLIPDPAGSEIVPAIPANQNMVGNFRALVPKAGQYTIRLKYEFPAETYNKVLRRTITYDSVAAEATFDYEIIFTMVDKDADGIDDDVEARLIEKYRPYYKFTLRDGRSDDFRPVDALAFVKQSTLIYYNSIPDPKNLNAKSGEVLLDQLDMDNHPEKSVSNGPWLQDRGAPSVVDNPSSTSYFLNPSTAIIPGADWQEIRSQGNIGLYAHVVKLRFANGSYEYDRHTIQSGENVGDKIFYKVEYWQFYAFNDGRGGIATQHEGDWTTVQLIINPQGGVNEDSIESVYYYDHGELEIMFRMPSVQFAHDHPMEPLTDHFVDYRGRNFGNGCRYPDATDNCNNNTIIFAQDPSTQRFTHPVVYIENGGHEPWPTNEGFYDGASGHAGDDPEHSYLTTTPPNLGEVNGPMDIPGALQVLLFNGSWGAKNGGARGPSLHWQWTWPENSATRWLIKPHSLTD